MTDEKQAWTDERKPLHEREWHQSGVSSNVFTDESYAVTFCRNPKIAARIAEDHNALLGKRDPQAWVEAVERLLNIANGLAIAVDMSRAYERSDAVASAFDAWEHNYATLLAIQEPPDAIADNLISRAPRRAGRSTLHQKEKTDEPT